MMRVSIVVAALLATCCSGVGVVRQQQQSNLHQHEDEIDQKSSAAVRPNTGLHYDYLGRLKTPATAQNPEGSVVVPSNSNTAANVKTSVAVGSNPLFIKDDDDSMSTGFSGTAEDLPTVENPKQITVEINERSTNRANHQFASTTATTTTVHYKAVASAPVVRSGSNVPKAGASGPSFHSEDSHDDHPIVVETMKFQYDASEEEGGWLDNSLPMLLVLACAVIAMVYKAEILEAVRGYQAKGKPDWTNQMMGPLVQEAMGAMGTVQKTAGLRREADNDDELLAPSDDEEEVVDLLDGEAP